MATQRGRRHDVAPGLDGANALLVRLCIKVLKAHRRAMTTRELSEALDAERGRRSEFRGVSSSVLSSKLNSFFRRFHSDAHTPSREQLMDLPLTRRPADDQPKRLVYIYTSPEEVPPTPEESASPGIDESLATSDGSESLHDENDVEHGEVIEPSKEPSSEDLRVETERTTISALETSSKNSETESKPHMQDQTEGLSEENATDEVKEEGKDSAPVKTDSDAVVVTGMKPSSPDPSRDVTNIKSEAQEPASKLRRVGFGPNSYVEAKRPATPDDSHDEEEERRHKKRSHMQPQRPNLYYDTLGSDSLTAVLTSTPMEALAPTPESEGDKFLLDVDFTSDFVSPEAIGLGDLDSLVC